MPRVRIAVQVHPQHADYAAIRRTVAAAEDLGADLVYNWDHFFPLYGPAEGKHFECWTMLAAWAEATETIEFGALVTCNSYRNPQLLADMCRTVDHISGGRVILGIGAGWFRRDYQEYGYEFGTGPTRAAALRAAIPLIFHRWSELNPPPIRRIPVLIAGRGEKVMLGLVARHADIWHAGFPDHAEGLDRPNQVLSEWCGRVGRDVMTIERSVGVEPDDLDRFLNEEADSCLTMGFTQFTLGFNGPDYDLGPLNDWLSWRDSLRSSAESREPRAENQEPRTGS